MKANRNNKNKMNRFLFLAILVPLFISCNAQEKNKTYYEGREFTYHVDISKDSGIIKKHKIKLKVTNGLRAKIMTGGQTGIKYFYTDIIDSTSGKPLVETTGVIDNDKRVFLHPPRFVYMTFAEIPPMPDINRKTKIGVSAETTLYGIKGHEDLDGKKIKQVTTIVAKKDVKLFGKEYKDVWIIKGQNTNYLEELGQYKVTYWFDQKYGFIRMKYEKPNGEIVDLKLKKVKD